MALPIAKRLKQDLEELYHELNVKIPKDLHEAAAHGDLRENAEYEAARSRQDFVRARIAQLQERMSQVSMYDLSNIPKGVIAYGSRVKLADIDTGEILEYEIVFPEEVDPASGKSLCIHLSAKPYSINPLTTKQKSSLHKANGHMRLSNY